MSITIGITSFNRGKYLESLLASLEQECIQYNHELILIDNFSTENKVFDAIHQYDDIIIKKILRKESFFEKQNFINDEYHAKELIIKHATNDIILFLQDDLQYIGFVDLIQQFADEFKKSPFYCMTCNAVRQQTLDNTLHSQNFGDVIKYRKFIDDHFHTMGFFKKEIFNKIGKYTTNYPLDMKYWGMAENDYDFRVKCLFDENISCASNIPLFVPIWNDSRGGYAFLRNGKRYGEYKSSSDKIYYKHLNFNTYSKLVDQNEPISFGTITQNDYCQPINWTLKRDHNNEPFKYPQSKVLIEGPVSDIND